jgi:hypothetical protein
LYGHETLSLSLPLSLREDHRLRVIENRVLRRISGPDREVVGGWSKLHNEKLHNLYASLHVVMTIKTRRVKLAGYLAPMRNEKCIQNVYRKT